MDKERYAVVKVAVDIANKKITCDPDPVQCYWVAGPADIRWTFPNLPEAVDSVIIEWRKTNNEKYRNKPMFRGQGTARSLSRAPLDDIVTYGNIKEKGKFKYAVYCLDKDGNPVAEVDPEGDNDDVPMP